MSLRRRVLLGCLAVAVVLLIADASIVATFQRFLVGRIDQRLVETAMHLAGDEQVPFVGPPVGGLGGPAGIGGRVLSDLYIGVLEPGDTSVVRVGPVLRETVEPPELSASSLLERAAGVGESPRPATVPAVSGRGSWRVVAVSRSGGDVVVVGMSLGDAQATLRHILLVVALASVAVLLTLLAVAVWVLRHGVSPLTAPEVASRIFERFFRGDASRTRARGGTGLGLSIVAAVAEAHGGRVAVDTAPGKGARFIVEIPLNAVPAAAPVPSSYPR